MMSTEISAAWLERHGFAMTAGPVLGCFERSTDDGTVVGVALTDMTMSVSDGLNSCGIRRRATRESVSELWQACSGKALIGWDEVQEIVDAWNEVREFCHVREITTARRETIQRRLKSAVWRTGWRKALEFVAGEEFYRGGNDSGWRANIDWFIRQGTVVRLLEQADRRGSGRAVSTENGRTRVRSDQLRDQLTRERQGGS